MNTEKRRRGKRGEIGGGKERKTIITV